MTDDIQEWARRGAQHRLEEIEQERATILRHFPDLDGSKPARGRRRSPTAATRSPVSRKGPSWTSAQREAVSVRMKKYWANRRKLQRR